MPQMATSLWPTLGNPEFTPELREKIVNGVLRWLVSYGRFGSVAGSAGGSWAPGFAEIGTGGGSRGTA